VGVPRKPRAPLFDLDLTGLHEGADSSQERLPLTKGKSPSKNKSSVFGVRTSPEALV